MIAACTRFSRSAVRHAMKLGMILSATLALVACSVSPPAARAAPVFDLFRFFDGVTHGDGQLKIRFKDFVSISVDSRGRMVGPNDFVLDQTITEAGKPPRTRQWRMHRDSSGAYAGTLTDAAGPVTGQVEGNRLHISYRQKDGLAVEQWLSLAPDTTYADNLMEIRKMGVPIAKIEETITRRAGPM